jgi:hypothetical protein
MVEKILADLKPEAAYFFADDSGQRSGSIVFDMADPSQIPAVAEQKSRCRRSWTRKTLPRRVHRLANGPRKKGTGLWGRWARCQGSTLKMN